MFLQMVRWISSNDTGLLTMVVRTLVRFSDFFIVLKNSKKNFMRIKKKGLLLKIWVQGYPD